MLQKITHRKEILKMDCNTYQAQLCVKFVFQAGLMTYFAFIIWSLIVRIEAGELGEPSLLREQDLADRALGDPWLFVQTPGESATFLRRESRGHNATPTPFSGVPRNLEDHAVGSDDESQFFSSDLQALDRNLKDMSKDLWKHFKELHTVWSDACKACLAHLEA
eukprot:g20726.t1